MFNSLKRISFNLSVLLAALIPAHPSWALPLSPGDRFEVSIPKDQYFAQVYEVNQDGDVEIPYLGTLAVAGLEPAQVKKQMSEALIEQGFFPPETLTLSIQMLLWAPIQVGISGEVHQPGRLTINEIAEDDRQRSIAPDTKLISGDFAPKRTLTTALAAAGGVLPTAQIDRVRIVRGRRERVVDLTGIFTGDAIEDIPLMAGDQVVVPTANQFQPQLMRPSSITPPGIKVFVSNLTVPANNNASSSIGNAFEGIVFPYGARFSQAVVATNCAGGIMATSGKRRATLMRVDRLTGETTTFDRSVEDLMRKSKSDADNPFLMPRDGVACYDSGVTNTRDVFNTISDILNPFSLILRAIF